MVHGGGNGSTAATPHEESLSGLLVGGAGGLNLAQRLLVSRERGLACSLLLWLPGRRGRRGHFDVVVGWCNGL